MNLNVTRLQNTNAKYTKINSKQRISGIIIRIDEYVQTTHSFSKINPLGRVLVTFDVPVAADKLRMT